MQKTLEQEFREYKEHHMYEMSVTALIVFEDKGIYDHELLEDYKDLDLTGSRRAYYVMNDLHNKALEGENNLYEEVYEMCWERVRDQIDNNKSYRIGIKYDN